MKIGLALGSGGAKGFFHIGALKALEKLKIKIDVISGTSIGAIIGGAYSLYANAQETEKIIFEVFDKYKKDILALKIFSASTSVEEKKLFLEKSFDFVKDVLLWNLRIIKPHLVDPKPFFRILRDIFKHHHFADCRIPFVATSVEINKGSRVFLDEGILYKMIMASCAIPGVFPPLKIEDNLLVDGGVLMALPTDALIKEVDFIIGINVEDAQEMSSSAAKNALDTMFIADRIRYREVLRNSVRKAQFMVSPDLGGTHWADFDKVKELVKKGEQETLKMAPALKKALRSHRIKRFFMPLSS